MLWKRYRLDELPVGEVDETLPEKSLFPFALGILVEGSGSSVASAVSGSEL